MTQTFNTRSTGTKRIVWLLAALFVLAGFGFVGQAAADHTVADDWLWFWGCGDNPNATAKNGDQMLLGLTDGACGGGVGPPSIFSLHPKAIAGSGPYTHTDADGNVVSAGTWEAITLISFTDYGHSGGSIHGGSLRMRVTFTDGTTGEVKTGQVKLVCTDLGKFATDPDPTNRPGPQQGLTIHLDGQNFKGIYNNFDGLGYNFYIPILP